MAEPTIPSLASALRLLGRPFQLPDFWIEVPITDRWEICVKDGHGWIELDQSPPESPNFRVRARGSERFYDCLEAAVADVRELLGMHLKRDEE